MLGTCEEECAIGPAGQCLHDGGLVVARDAKDVVIHFWNRRFRRVDRVAHRVVQVAIDEHVDSVVEGCREQHLLALARNAIEQTLHSGKEAEIGHVIGFVDHGDLDRTQ